MIGFDPTDEQALIAETVRQFVENEVRPHSRDCDEAGALSKDVLSQAHELGLVANGLPEAYGGGGERNAVTSCLIIEELAWGDLSLALGILSPSLLGIPVADFGTEAQRAELLPSLCADSFEPGCLAIVEPYFDFDPTALKTRAQRDGSDYRLDGTKCLVPWLDGNGPVLVVAHDEQAGTPQAFLMPRGTRGLTATPEANLGLAGLPTVELELEAVRVPAVARLGGDQGIRLRSLLDRGRIAMAAAAVGVARASFELARDYAKEREAFGAPIATKQAIAFKLADMAIEIDAARLLTWEAADTLENVGERGGQEEVTRQARLAFDKARRTVLEVSDGSVQVFGGYGYIRDYLPEMHLRNAGGFGSFEALCLL
jgi:alkylation response protein AidB-like acyl-CoA dehydrogenase